MTIYRQKKTKPVNVAHTYYEYNVARVTSGEGKPQIVLDYNDRYGGVDHMDHYLELIRFKNRTERWPVKIFMHVLGMAVCNALILYKLANPDSKITIREFMGRIADELKALYWRVEISPTARFKGTHRPMSVENIPNLICKVLGTCEYCDHRSRNGCSCGIVVCDACYYMHFTDQFFKSNLEWVLSVCSHRYMYITSHSKLIKIWLETYWTSAV